MEHDIPGMLLTAVVLLSLLALGEVGRARGAGNEATRKFSHIACGAWILGFPWLFTSVHSVGLLGAMFAVLLLVTRHFGWLQSIHAVDRSGHGAAWYPAGVYFAGLLTWREPGLFVATVLLLALSDGLAALVGRRFGRRSYPVHGSTRTIEGSATAFVVSWLAVVGCLVGFGLAPPLAACVIGLVAGALVTAVEGMSPWGTDNVLVPVVAGAYLAATADLDMPALMAHLAAAGLSATIVGISVWRAHLTATGAFAAWLMGFVVLACGGGGWFGALLLVFVAVNLASRVAHGHKPLQGKGARRDHLQIFANVGLGGVAALVFGLTGSPAALWAYAGALGAAAADTLASELGVLSPETPRRITSLQPVAPGTSGGVTVAGYGAALLGGVLPTAGYLAATGSFAPALVLAGGIGGMAGSTADSVIGDLWQARYRCTACEADTEDHVHCGVIGHHTHGPRWMTNDAVNLLGSLTGAITGLALYGWMG